MTSKSSDAVPLRGRTAYLEIMYSSRASGELHSLMEGVAQLLLSSGEAWVNRVLDRAWIDHNLSEIALRSVPPFHDVVVEDFSYEDWRSGQLFKLVRDALLRAQLNIEEVDFLELLLTATTARATWRRKANGEWLMSVEVQATIRLRDGISISQRVTRDRLVPNLMLLAEGMEAQPPR